MKTFVIALALTAVGLALAAARPVVVELCCGAAAVGAVVLDRVPEVELVVSDVDPVAVECARRNMGGRAAVLQGDLDSALPDRLRGRVDVLVANAPYVPTDAIASMPVEARLHEPRTALDGGSDGLAVARRIAALAPRWLAPGGHLVIESSRAQAPVLQAAYERAGLDAGVTSDDDRDATAVVGRRPVVSA